MIARAELRSAVRRLIAASQTLSPTVEVQTRDLEILIAAAAAKIGADRISHPNMHPEQR